MEYAYFFAGVISGIIIGIILFKLLINTKTENDTFSKKFEEEFNSIKVQLAQERDKVLQLTGQLTALETTKESIQTKLQSEQQIEEKYQKEFEIIAAKILKTNTTEFSQTSKKEVEEILKPFKEKISELEKKITETTTKSATDKTAIETQIKLLCETSTKIGTEANNLAKALKGQVKTHGTWGEIILEKVLEASGLEELQHYQKQQHFKDDEGKGLQPDVVIKLPDNKHVIIDSKVSLVSYEKYFNANSEEEREQQLKYFLTSVKNHITGLGGKYYQNIKGINTPDYVLMFIPIESCYSLIIQHGSDLIQQAWKNKILLVSPCTLFAALRTINIFWHQDKQNRNVIEIANESGKLYDKFVGLLTNLSTVSKKLDETRKSFDESLGKLQGRGNLIKQVEKLKKLGANTSKSIPANYLEDSEEDIIIPEKPVALINVDNSKVESSSLSSGSYFVTDKYSEENNNNSNTTALIEASEVFEPQVENETDPKEEILMADNCMDESEEVFNSSENSEEQITVESEEVQNESYSNNNDSESEDYSFDSDDEEFGFNDADNVIRVDVSEQAEEPVNKATGSQFYPW